MQRRKPSTKALRPLSLIAALMFATATFASGSTIYAFPSAGSQGALPSANLVSDSAGNLYGTTVLGGAFGNGAVFELLKPVPPSTEWAETVLYSFSGLTDGAQPSAGVIFDSAGNLYGTTYQGGTINVHCPVGCGTVFELSPPAAPGGSWTATVLHSFQGGGDGAKSVSGLVFDQKGILYGTTAGGGVNNVGTVFMLTPPATPGEPWVESVIFTFSAAQYPRGTPVVDSRGNLYGTTYADTTRDAGVAFRLAPPAKQGGAWRYRVIYSFGSSPTDSSNPNATLALHNGHLYGTAFSGGEYNHGTVFELSPPAVAGGTWSEVVLYSFGAVTNDGVAASGNTLFDKTGNIFSMTIYGGGKGANICGGGGCGTIFKLTPPTSPGGDWTESVLHAFSGGKDGGEPWGGLAFGKNGVLYGTAELGGSGKNGAVFGLAP